MHNIHFLVKLAIYVIYPHLKIRHFVTLDEYGNYMRITNNEKQLPKELSGGANVRAETIKMVTG